MSSGCVIEKTLSGDAEIIYEKIVFLTRELEKRGLKVDIKKKGETLNDRYSISDFNNSGTTLKFPSLINGFNIFDNNKSNISIDPGELTSPYKRFRELISGGGMNYMIRSIKIEIIIN
jgi:hypothetical protein